MPLDILDLRHVAAVGRQRSLGRAAQALGISQPALSKCLLALERPLGVPLFDRSHRGVTPTGFSEVVLAAADPMLRDVDGVVAEIRRLQGLDGNLACR